MRAHRLLPVSLVLFLSGCTLFGGQMKPVTALERTLNGTFEGHALGITGKAPYRLTLVYTERLRQATGVLTNMQTNRTYAVNGKFTWTDTRGTLALRVYEDSAHRATFQGEMTENSVTGRLNSVLFGKEVLPFNLSLSRVKTPDAAP